MTTPVHQDLDLQWELTGSAEKDLDLQFSVVNDPYVGNVELPALEGEATGESGQLIDGAGVLPGLLGSGELLPGNVGDGLGELSGLTGEAHGPASGFAELPALEGEATGLVGSTAHGLGLLAAVTGEGSSDALGIGFGAAYLPALTGAAGGVTGALASGDIVLPALQGSAQGVTGSLGHGAGEMPAVIGFSISFSTNDANGFAVLPAITAFGLIQHPLLETQAWSLNPEVIAHTRYTSGFDFTSFAMLNGKVYGVRPDGVYLLEGDDDEGEPIQAEFRAGLDDLGDESLKTSPVAYASFTSAGPLELTVKVDGGAQYTYPLDRPRHADGHGPSRFALGLGLRSRYWQIGVRNVGGAYFEFDKLGLAAAALRRKS